MGQAELARRVRKNLVDSGYLPQDGEWPRDNINKLEKQGKPEFPKPEIIMAIAAAVGRPLMEALEQLGYEFPAGENSRINPSLAESLEDLSWPAQEHLAENLASLLKLAAELRTPALARAAEPPVPYRPQHRRKKPRE